MKRTGNPDMFRKSLLLLLVLGWIAGAAAAPLSAAGAGPVDVKTLYRQAVEAFRNANTLAAADPEKAQELYRKAVMRFERIAREGGVHNGKLYYDIGNTYFKMKDIGRAILNYRRAEQFIPNDPNLRQNLNFARRKRVDHIEEKQETRILKTVFFWHYDLSTRTRVYLFAVVFMLLWIFAAVRMFRRRPFTVWCIAVSLLFSILLGGSLVAEQVHRQRTRPGVVISEQVVARKGNSVTYEPSFKEPLHAGAEFTLMETRGDWCRIALPDSRTCWVPKTDIEMVR
ncbi:MAG: tetratricopeptide repeat protein [Desulfobacterales bacterium]|jgi:hypothetical protein